MSKPRTLFILKKRSTSYDGGTAHGPVLTSSGLLNSARFVHDMLVDNGMSSALVQVVDNNDIDRVVTAYNPTIVVIEAFWVVPEKFTVLRRLYPHVQWVIRSHSEIPFAAGEGSTMTWFFDYVLHENVSVAFNTERTTEEFQRLLSLRFPRLSLRQLKDKVRYLPNYYPVSRASVVPHGSKRRTIRVGCFGAIRPLKNQLIQAVAAIRYAADRGLGLEFHVNGTRIESGASNHKKNLVELFAGLNSKQFQLVEHDWLSHKDFTQLVRTMDIGMQVSFNESFNIVTADFVNAGVPVVVSSDVSWVSPWFYAECTSSVSMVAAMSRALWHQRWVTPWVDVNKDRLRQYSIASEAVWLTELWGMSARR